MFIAPCQSGKHQEKWQPQGCGPGSEDISWKLWVLALVSKQDAKRNALVNDSEFVLCTTKWLYCLYFGIFFIFSLVILEIQPV